MDRKEFEMLVLLTSEWQKYTVCRSEYVTARQVVVLEMINPSGRSDDQTAIDMNAMEATGNAYLVSSMRLNGLFLELCSHIFEKSAEDEVVALMDKIKNKTAH